MIFKYCFVAEIEYHLCYQGGNCLFLIIINMGGFLKSSLSSLWSRMKTFSEALRLFGFWFVYYFLCSFGCLLCLFVPPPPPYHMGGFLRSSLWSRVKTFSELKCWNRCQIAKIGKTLELETRRNILSSGSEQPPLQSPTDVCPKV